MSNVNWNGNGFVAQMQRVMKARTSAASIRLASQIKAEISQDGTLRYHPMGKKGRPLKSTKTRYNFTHSRPGNPPYKQTGHLRRSIAWELIEAGPAVIGRVGTHYPYGRYLELGTSRMARRPFLVATLSKHIGEIRGILTATIGPGGLADVVSNQFRPGVMGRGGRAF